jgi:hypothetical protein
MTSRKHMNLWPWEEQRTLYFVTSAGDPSQRVQFQVLESTGGSSHPVTFSFVKRWRMPVRLQEGHYLIWLCSELQECKSI